MRKIIIKIRNIEKTSCGANSKVLIVWGIAGLSCLRPMTPWRNWDHVPAHGLELSELADLVKVKHIVDFFTFGILCESAACQDALHSRIIAACLRSSRREGAEL